MTDIFLSPVGDDWIDKFDQTVDSPLDVSANPPDELEGFSQLRVWGTTEGEGEQKRTTFEAMNPGDTVLFLHDSEFIALGRVGKTFENPELGEWIWGTHKESICVHSNGLPDNVSATACGVGLARI